MIRCLESLADDPLTPRLTTLTCPTLLVVGEKDPMGVGMPNRMSTLVAAAVDLDAHRDRRDRDEGGSG